MLHSRLHALLRLIGVRRALQRPQIYIVVLVDVFIFVRAKQVSPILLALAELATKLVDIK